MENVKETKLMYDLLLSVPGMNDVVKLDLKLPRKSILFLCQLLSQSLSGKGSLMQDLMPKEVAEELQRVVAESLERACLSELVPKLKSF